MKKFLFPFAVLVLSCMVLTVVVKGVYAQSYPNKPINLIVAYQAGRGNDVRARLVAQNLTESLGQQVIVINKPGADGALGAEMAAKAAPDGYTLFWGDDGSLVVTPNLQKEVRYDPIKDFEPITHVNTLPLALVVSSSLPVKSVKELIALAKSKPGQINYASWASICYLYMEIFKQTTGVNMLQIPYKGMGPAITALLSGEAQVTLASVDTLLPHIKSGRVRALAIASNKHSPLAPDLPTMAESGVPLEFGGWCGLLAPAGTPKEIIKKLNSEVIKVLRIPKVTEYFSNIGGVVGSTPEEFGDLIKADLRKFAKAIKDTGLK